MGRLTTNKIQLFLLSVLMLGSIVYAGDKNRIKIGGSVVVPKHERVKDAVSIGGDTKVYGTVYGSAVAVGGDVYLGPGAEVHDDCVSVGGKIILSEGAVVYGEIVEIDGFSFSPPFFDGVWRGKQWNIPWFFTLIPFMAILVIGAVFIAILPRQFGFVTETIELETGKSFLAGLAGMILFIPAILTLVVSLLGIPLIPLFAITVVFLMFFGYFSAAAVLGKRLVTRLGNTTTSAILHVIAGLFLLWLIGLIPFLGGVVKFIVYLIGWGAVLIALYNWRQTKKQRPVLSRPTPAEPAEKAE